MGAFIIAGVILVISVGTFALALGGAAMSDSPSASDASVSFGFSALIGGAVLSGLVASSHWWPHIGW